MLLPGTLSVFLCALAVLAGTARGAEREISRTFVVRPGCSLLVDTYRGDITIEETDAAEVRIGIYFDFDVDTEAEADRIRAGLALQLKSEGNTVSAIARNPVETGFRLSWREKKRMNLSYRIFVPKACNLDLKTRGNITVGRLAGRMSARSGEGTIFFRRVEGSIDAAADAGDVVISHCTGDVTVRVRRGTIRIGSVEGQADLRNSNGGIEAMRVAGKLTAFAEVGDVNVSFPRSVSQPAILTSAGGNVWVKIDPAARCEIEAVATWGRVENTLALDDKPGGTGRRRLAGRLNGGGPILHFAANGGSVKIEPGETGLE